MYPYGNWFRWYLAGKHAHLIEATREKADAFREPYRSILTNRAARMSVALKVRLAFVLLLNLGLIATAAAWLATFLDPFADLGSALGTLAQGFTGASVVFMGLVLLANRHLGQLEGDMISAMALGSPGSPPVDKHEEEEVRRLEAAGDRPGVFSRRGA